MKTNTSSVSFLKETFLISLWLLCVYVMYTFALTLWMHSPTVEQRYAKVKKQTSPSELIRAPGRESDCKRISSIMPISLLHMPPLCFSSKHFVVFPPSAFWFLSSSSFPLRAPPHSLVIIHLKLMSIHFCKYRAHFVGRKTNFSISMHSAIGVKGLEWMLHSFTALYFAIHSVERSVGVLQVDSSTTWVIHWLYIWTTKEENEGAEEERKW